MKFSKIVLFPTLLISIFAAPVSEAGTLTPTYTSSISPGGPEGGEGTIKSDGSSVTITPTSITALSKSAQEESFGSITWKPSVQMTVTLAFDYQIKDPGGSCSWRGDWFSGTLVYTDGKVKSFSQTFDIEDEVSISVKAKNGSVSITNISVQ